MKEFYAFARLAIDACPDGLSAMTHRIVAGSSPSSQPSAKQNWWRERILTPIASIQSSFELLLDLHVYVGQYPYGGTRISPMAHLRFNVQSYFQEVYVIRQRTIDLLNIAKKEFETRDDGTSVAETCDRLCRDLKPRIEAAIEPRREHVHKWGFNTYSFAWLDAIELVLNANPELLDKSARHKFKTFFDEKYSEERQLWSDAFEEANEVIGEILDDCARELKLVFFDTSGQLRYPLPTGE